MIELVKCPDHDNTYIVFYNKMRHSRVIKIDGKWKSIMLGRTLGTGDTPEQAAEIAIKYSKRQGFC